MTNPKQKTLKEFEKEFKGFFEKPSDYDVVGVKKRATQFLSNSLTTIEKETARRARGEVIKEIEKEVSSLPLCNICGSGKAIRKILSKLKNA
jgi:hypothetical protein